MGSSGPLMIANHGNEGEFLTWLKTLALNSFVESYPLSKLAEWNWLKPQFRLHFPPNLIRRFEDYSESDSPLDPESSLFAQLCNPTWWFRSTDEPFWFIHPFFRSGDQAGQLLRQQGLWINTQPIPNDVRLSNGRSVAPYADYFYHWQAYALIDIIRLSDCYPALLETPEVILRAQRLLELVKFASNWKPEEILELQTRWGGLAEPMTWLSHYRAFKGAIMLQENRSEDSTSLPKLGAKALAKHLKIKIEDIETAVKEKLLVLAQDWIHCSKDDRQFVDKAWPQLQIDIYNAVEWLCYLGDKTLDDYLDKWKHEPFYHREWAQLHDVLPFEFYKDKEYFLRHAPIYLEEFNVLLPEKDRLTDARLRLRVDQLLRKSYSFGSFVRAFCQMHDSLSHKGEDFGKIDFRDRRPLDYYLILSITPEVAFRDALKRRNKLPPHNRKNGTSHGLQLYIELLAGQVGVESAGRCFSQNIPLTKQHDEPESRVSKLSALPTGLSPYEDYLAKAFLCCQFARNYFAHHDYLGGKLLRSDYAGFLFSGILVTVLTLLPEPSN